VAIGIISSLLAAGGFRRGLPHLATAHAASESRSLRCLELCVASEPTLLPCLGDKELDLYYHKCHSVGNKEFARVTPCLRECLGDTTPERALPPLRNKQLLHLAQSIDACSAPGALSFDATAPSGELASSLMQTLHQCGVVLLQGLVPGDAAAAARAQMGALSAHELQKMLMRKTQSADPNNHTGLPFEANLRGGRYQIIAPATPAVADIVSAVGGGVVASALHELWASGDDGAGPQLGYVTGMFQVRVRVRGLESEVRGQRAEVLF
jgi:hypothetical protein